MLNVYRAPKAFGHFKKMIVKHIWHNFIAISYDKESGVNTILFKYYEDENKKAGKQIYYELTNKQYTAIMEYSRKQYKTCYKLT